MDMERIKYLVVSYLRVRLNKVALVPLAHWQIEKYHRYILKHDLIARLSSDELQFIKESLPVNACHPRFEQLSTQYLHSSVLEHFERPPYVTEDPQLNEISRVSALFTR